MSYKTGSPVFSTSNIYSPNTEERIFQNLLNANMEAAMSRSSLGYLCANILSYSEGRMENTGFGVKGSSFWGCTFTSEYEQFHPHKVLTNGMYFYIEQFFERSHYAFPNRLMTKIKIHTENSTDLKDLLSLFMHGTMAFEDTVLLHTIFENLLYEFSSSAEISMEHDENLHVTKTKLYIGNLMITDEFCLRTLSYDIQHVTKYSIKHFDSLEITNRQESSRHELLRLIFHKHFGISYDLTRYPSIDNIITGELPTEDELLILKMADLDGGLLFHPTKNETTISSIVRGFPIQKQYHHLLFEDKPLFDFIHLIMREKLS